FPVQGVTGDEVFADERAAALGMAGALGTAHRQLEVEPGDMSRLLPRLVWHLEDLRVGSSYHNYEVARLASCSVKVVLSGAGGDELFAGYPWRYRHALASSSAGDFVRRYAAYWSLLVPDAEEGDFVASPAAPVPGGVSAPAA